MRTPVELSDAIIKMRELNKDPILRRRGPVQIARTNGCEMLDTRSLTEQLRIPFDVAGTIERSRLKLFWRLINLIYRSIIDSCPELQHLYNISVAHEPMLPFPLKDN